ncbi:protein of unknown function [Agreia sp. COWG]|nr:protein of unknown function [Agreia sp. COWG]
MGGRSEQQSFHRASRSQPLGTCLTITAPDAAPHDEPPPRQRPRECRRHSAGALVRRAGRRVRPARV